MKEYIFGCIAVGFITAIAMHLSHSAYKSTTRIATGLMLLLFVLTPVSALIRGLADLKLPSAPSPELPGEDEYTEVAEDAFCLGIGEAIAERYSVTASDITVLCDGFNFETVSAERIYITLRGEARVLDYRAVKDYIENNINVGECDVRIDVG